MNLKLIRYFVTIAESGSIAAASRLLNVSASPLSRRLREFEEAVGLKLFDRDKGLTLTPEGQKLLEIARRISGLSNEMHALARELNRKTPVLNIGLRSTHPRLRGALLQHIRTARPDASVSVHPMVPDQQLIALANGTIDFATVRLPVSASHADISFLPVLSEELGFAVPDRPPFSERRKLTLNDVTGLKLIAHYAPHHPMLDPLLKEGGRPVVVDPNVAGGAAALISQGDHFTMLPLDPESPARRAIDEPGVLFRPIAGRAVTFTTILAWRTDRGEQELADVLAVLKSAFSRPERL